MTANAPKKDPYINIKKVLSELLECEDSINFREPVDYKKLGLFDYPLIIKNPMDLSTIKKKLKLKKYKKIQDFVDDVQSIWDNCKSYNVEGSAICKEALKMEKHAKRLFKKHLNMKKIHEKKNNTPKINNTPFPQIPPNEFLYQKTCTLSEENKLKLGNLMNNASQEFLFKVVEIIKNEAPQKIRIISDEAFSILLEELPQSCLDRIIELKSGNETLKLNEVSSEAKDNMELEFYQEKK